MAKKKFWNKVKNIFVEEVKTKKNNIEILDEIEKQNPKKLEEKEINNIIKILINEIIDGRDNKKEDIIKALKHCEEVYFEEEKELEILAAIGNMQNDSEILIEFINAAENYTDEDDHIKIREKRNEAIKKLNEIKLENIINEEENSYTDKNNIITVLNLIKNEQIQFENKEELKTKIIIIFNNIKEELYNDIEVLESLFQVLDNKLKNVESKEIEKTKKDIKRKIDIYYNTPGTNKEKTEAIIQIPINKIEEKEKQDTKETTSEIKKENQTDEPQIIKEETTPEIKEENKINTPQVEKQEIKNDIQIKEEYSKVDYTDILKKQEDRIKNAKNITDEEKQNLIEELYKDFETYVGGTYNNSKTL